MRFIVGVIMEYVSDVLSHFVGRSLAKDDERFELLVSIIKEGKLLGNPNRDKTDYRVLMLSPDYDGNRLGELYDMCSCVCFCDIPKDALRIHVGKYGKFGLGFSKEYLSSKGVRPVQYIPKNARITTPDYISNDDNMLSYLLKMSRRGTALLSVFDVMDSAYNFRNLLAGIVNVPENIPKMKLLNLGGTIGQILNGESHKLIYSLEMFFGMQMAYYKVFDETLSDDDPDNYYMEREWRFVGDVAFDVSDIKTVYLPNEYYKNRFLEIFNNENINIELLDSII